MTSQEGVVVLVLRYRLGSVHQGQRGRAERTQLVRLNGALLRLAKRGALEIERVAQLVGGSSNGGLQLVERDSLALLFLLGLDHERVHDRSLRLGRHREGIPIVCLNEKEDAF